MIVTLPPFIQQAVQGGLLQAYQSVNYKNVPAIAKASNGAWATFVNNYFSFAINPEVTKTQPKTFADLLHPDYSGKVAYSNPATAGDGMAVIILTTSLMGEDKAFDYLKKLEKSAKFHTKGTGYLDVLLSRNEIAFANGDLQMDLDDAANGGLSLKPIFLAAKPGDEPTTFQLPYAIGLIKGGPNQAEGKKLIDYLMSTEVQAKVPDIFGIPGRTDVPLAGKNGEAVKQAIAGVKLIPVDWNQVMDEEGRLDRALEERRDRHRRASRSKWSSRSQSALACHSTCFLSRANRALSALIVGGSNREYCCLAHPAALDARRTRSMPRFEHAGRRADRPSERALRHAHGARRSVADHPARRIADRARPQRLRQDDVAAVHRRASSKRTAWRAR